MTPDEKIIYNSKLVRIIVTDNANPIQLTNKKLIKRFIQKLTPGMVIGMFGVPGETCVLITDLKKADVTRFIED